MLIKFCSYTMKFPLLSLLLYIPLILQAQKVTVNPTISPAAFNPSDQITVTYDVTGTSLATLSEAWIWVWIPDTNINAKYNINPATTAADPAKFTKSTANSKVTFSITFKPSDFFTSSIANEKKLGMLIKANDWSGGQSTDYVAGIGFQIKINAPTSTLVYDQSGATIAIDAETPSSADFKLFLNETLTDSKQGITRYQYSLTLPSSPTNGTVKITATPAGGTTATEYSFQYLIGEKSPTVVRPSGIRPGINYVSDPTKVILCLQAPGKSTVHALGDFSTWKVLAQNLMNRDGEYFWIELGGLTAGQEYAFQYLIDGTFRMADPFSDKILDPDDKFIPASVYPNLRTYPNDAFSPAIWYYNRLSTFQTNRTPFNWKSNGYTRPAKESLVIYELLIRDFFGSEKRTYQSLIDTVSYFKRLGVNAIQLMPVMEFNGNESWGYNPTFMFAPDKAYGTREKLKEFIDLCHANGIAVILDIALNHQDLPNPMVMMDFDFAAMKPTTANKWFNPDATHPFSVFYDMNHESVYTKQYLDTVNRYWMSEYKIDGFRFDLSKGFTQTSNPTNVSAWGNYDASRVAILKRMADKIWEADPSAYVILEHLADNSEERALADYRGNEGKGMMLWGKMTDQYNEATMGYGAGAAIAQAYHGTRGWQTANLVSYMESHDEERLMFKNITYGNTKGEYSAKDIGTALRRVRAASTVFYTIPGPKMLWQFGELGFDKSINTCSNGTINPPGAEGGNGDCRLDIKPTVWDYRAVPERAALFNLTAELIKLKTTYPVFQSGTLNFINDNLIKQFAVRSKNYTANPTGPQNMNALVVASLEMEPKSVSLTFPHEGTWHEYFTGATISVGSAGASVQLFPGDYRIYTDLPVGQVVTGSDVPKDDDRLRAYPNPADDHLRLNRPADRVTLYMMSGTPVQLDKLQDGSWDLGPIPSGFYVGIAERNGKKHRFKVMRR
ncbi:MAG: alpha-amylase family glycosyl hydrolase [Bacteroidota bacterium]